jgi:hypothetical protein
MDGYSLMNSSRGGNGWGMICSESKKEKDNVVVIVVCVLIGVIVVIAVVVVIVIVVVHKRDVSGDYIEMDDDMIYVSMENGSKKPLEIVSTLSDNPTTIVYRGVVDGNKDVVVKVMKMCGSKLEASEEREMELCLTDLRGRER